MITIENVDYPTKISELTLEQWAKVSFAIHSFESKPIEQLEAVLTAIGVPSKVVDNIELEFGKELSQALISEADGLEIVEEVAGYKLELPEKVTIKMSKFIDVICKKFEPTLALIAFCYRDQRVSDNEHYDVNHIKHKISVLGKEMAVNFVVSAAEITSKLTGQLDVSK